MTDTSILVEAEVLRQEFGINSIRGATRILLEPPQRAGGDDPHGDSIVFALLDFKIFVAERFAQTGTGWVLRELGLAEPARVVAFIEANLATFSSEGLRYATEKMPAETKARLKEMHRARGGKAP